ncbi:putative acetyltransferase [Halolamina pelagica]|uniref:Putative acetyltransferase n=1 Tax=Halolamina pelagica TaxID=699431 RepID=A0A0P7H8T2_9EURY|nr:GNAT family N-acetyltransferase [Halolamina pelagica]KPN29929.1 putative acetyltransferase [Halolamina pelagica]
MDRGFVLPNVGPGPDPLSFWELDASFAVLLLHRDFYCSECRQQIRRVKKRYDEFEARDAEVVSVLPEDRETATEWQKQYHLPFPTLADPDTELGDRFDQPTRFGLLGKLHDVIGRMPAAIVLDLRGDEPVESYAHRGDSRTDRPRIDELLEAVDHAATSSAAEGADSPDSVEIDRVEPTASADPLDDGTPTDDARTDGVVDEGGSDASDADAQADDALSPREAEPKPQRPLRTPEGVDLPEGVELRRGDSDDVVAAMRVLQGALLDIDGSTVRDAAPAGELLLAEEGDWVVGALVLRDGHVEGVAVRRERRGQGIGSALVEAAVLDEGSTVTADFRAGVRGFWKDLGFEVEQEGSRFWGVRTP